MNGLDISASTRPHEARPSVPSASLSQPSLPSDGFPQPLAASQRFVATTSVLDQVKQMADGVTDLRRAANLLGSPPRVQPAASAAEGRLPPKPMQASNWATTGLAVPPSPIKLAGRAAEVTSPMSPVQPSRAASSRQEQIPTRPPMAWCAHIS